MNLKKLPKGIQDFKKLVRGDFVYVDKTELIYKLVTEGICYFLSRPRRFGKSLLISTLGALFRGEKKLFSGLWISQSDYDWQPSPVITLDFSRLASGSARDLEDSFNRYLVDVARQLGVLIDARPRPSETLSLLAEELQASGEVVLLIDEYDAPLVKHLEESELTRANRQVLQEFFSTVKSLQPVLRFVFVTGVSRFTKVSLFSGMNSLDDISFSDDYSAIAGLTEIEIDQYLDEYIIKLADKQEVAPETILDQLHQWYDGYRFATGGEPVFNPWAVMNCLSARKFKNYWFSTATPSFAIDLIKQENWSLMQLDSQIVASDEIEANYDPDRIDLVPLLYQTGYLTIDKYDPVTRAYHLRVPNEEVMQSLVDHLLHTYAKGEESDVKSTLAILAKRLADDDLEGFFSSFNTLLAGIPYPLHIPREAYYHSILYLCVRSLSFSVGAEVFTSRGRIDLVIDFPDRVYLFEFKADQSAAVALNQIKEQEYARRFEAQGKEIVLIGAKSNSKKRELSEWCQERITHLDRTGTQIETTQTTAMSRA